MLSLVLHSASYFLLVVYCGNVRLVLTGGSSRGVSPDDVMLLVVYVALFIMVTGSSSRVVSPDDV